tara:strand:+ start:3568 stop:4599 length:1032 start_codon:yes stop_codon:yes gene_type:complete
LLHFFIPDGLENFVSRLQISDVGVPTPCRTHTLHGDVMSTFFSPLEEDDVLRTAQDENAERLAEQSLRVVRDRTRVFPLWSAETKDAIANDTLKPKVLVIATTPFACDLVFDTAQASTSILKTLGTITVAGVTSKGIGLVNETKNDPVSTLSAIEGDETNTLLLTARHDVPNELSNEYARVVCDSLKPEKIVVITAVDERAGAFNDFDECAYVLETSGNASDIDAKVADLQLNPSTKRTTLPSGVLLDGIAAAILSRREMVGEYCLVVAVPTPHGQTSSAFKSKGTGSGFGPGFGGGVDFRCAQSACELVHSMSSLDLGVGLKWRLEVGYGPVIGGDADRVFS